LAPMSTSLSASVASTRGGAPTAPNAQNLHRRHRPVATRAAAASPGARDSSERPARAVPAEDDATAALSRRVVLASACAVALAPIATADAARADPAEVGSADGTREFDFKTYKLVVPRVYDEVPIPLKDPATGAVSPTTLLLKDTRVGQAGNTISLSKQRIPEGGIAKVSDIGSPEETATRLVAAESQRKGGANSAVVGASQRTGAGGLLYYTAEYKKSVLGVPRRVVTTLVVADGTLYTLTAEEDENRFVNEMGAALRATAESFEVVPY